ncbi:hypothetical protein [Halomonas sp. Cn5-12]|uniref:hypothetical protein n=1 Tax=Halomonas sp. Cn5-12 TaxID=2908885 RepID=UPI001F34DC05|nr:hypothetical protein [Halomonas sp. Cn5-12]MCF2911747.1 hypothetical protein [Halomonas sp. Cn5-12]
MSYEAWRISFQDSEQAAKAAFEEAQRYKRMFTMSIDSIVELTEAAGIRKEDQTMGGTVQALAAIEKLKKRRDKWKARALEAEQFNREMVAKAASNYLGGYRELGRRTAAAEEERDALAAYQADLIRELTACQAVLHTLAHDGEVTPAYADDAKTVLKRAPKESLKTLCADQQQQGCLRVAEELRNGTIDWNKFGDTPREQAANVVILVGNQIRREAGGTQ